MRLLISFNCRCLDISFQVISKTILSDLTLHSLIASKNLQWLCQTHVSLLSDMHQDVSHDIPVIHKICLSMPLQRLLV